MKVFDYLTYRFFVLTAVALFALPSPKAFAFDRAPFLEVSAPSVVRNLEQPISVRIAIASLDDSTLTVQKLSFFGESGLQIQAQNPSKQLNPLRGRVSRSELRRLLLAGSQRSHAAVSLDEKEFGESLYLSQTKLSLGEIQKGFSQGQEAKLRIVANLMTPQGRQEIGREISVLYAEPLPTPVDGQSNWVAGDGHVHTGFSTLRDGMPAWLSPYDRAQEASVAGLGWLYVTDHAPFMTKETPEDTMQNWDSYLTQVGKAQETGIIVLPGLELSTMDVDERAAVQQDFSPPYDSHLLAYGLVSFVPQPDSLARRAADGWTGQRLVGDVTQNFPSVSFSSIAHPESDRYPWFPWWDEADGFRSIEIINGAELLASGREGTDRSLARWDRLLKSGLKDSAGNGRFVAASANSDVHFGLYTQNFTRAVTYLALPDAHRFNYFDVHEALKNGRMVSSMDGSLAYFSLNNGHIGDLVELTPGEEIDIRLKAFPVDGRRVRRIRLISNYAKASFPSGTTLIRLNPNTRNEFPYPASDSYFRVEVDFAYKGQIYTTYTNPIFVRLQPVEERDPIGNQTSLSTDVEPDDQGIFRSRPTVTLTNQTGSSIFYRWDAEAWQRYGKPFEAPLGEHLLSFKAVSDTWIATERFVVEPETVLTTNIASNSIGWFTRGQPSITLENSEARSIYYQWDTQDGRWLTYRNPFEAPLGVHTLYYYSDVDELDISSKEFKVGNPPDQQPEGLAWTWTLPVRAWVASAQSDDRTVFAGDRLRTYIWLNKPLGLGYANVELHAVGQNGEEMATIGGATLYPWDSGWIKLQVSGQAPAGAAAVHVAVMSYDFPGGTIYLDAWGYANFTADDWQVGQFEGNAFPFLLDPVWQPADASFVAPTVS